MTMCGDRRGTHHDGDLMAVFPPPGTKRHCWLRLRTHSWVPDLKPAYTGWVGRYCTDCGKRQKPTVPPASAFRR
jgi:hypothetical protein